MKIISLRKIPKHAVDHWQWWLFYISVPSIVVCVHFTWLSGDGDDGFLSSSSTTHLDAPDEAERFIIKEAELSKSNHDEAPPLRSFIDPVWLDWGSDISQYETLV